MKVIIVGGVAGGASCAARLRRLDESAQIIVFEKSGFVSYANCGLPYYVGGTIAEKSALTLQTPASFRARFNVDVRVRHEVVAIDRARKVVTVRDLENGREFAESYDKLVLSPGARPVVPPLPGIDGKNIFTLRTVEDALRIREFVAGGDRAPRARRRGRRRLHRAGNGGKPRRARREGDHRGKDGAAFEPAGRGHGRLCPRQVPRRGAFAAAGLRRDRL